MGTRRRRYRRSPGRSIPLPLCFGGADVSLDVEVDRRLHRIAQFDDVIPVLKDNCEIVAITRSEKGSTIVRGETITEVKAEPVSKVVDTTGAGDAYAAGFLYGYTEGLNMAQCGQLGSIAAAEVISHIGPRPQVRLSDLIPKRAA